MRLLTGLLLMGVVIFLAYAALCLAAPMEQKAAYTWPVKSERATWDKGLSVWSETAVQVAGIEVRWSADGGVASGDTLIRPFTAAWNATGEVKVFPCDTEVERKICGEIRWQIPWIWRGMSVLMGAGRFKTDSPI